MGIAARIRSTLIGEAVELPAEIAARYPELCHARWRRGGLPPRIGGWPLGASTVAGITLWRTIWLAPDTPWEPELLLHELRHVHQFASSTTFPLRYIWQTMWRGYRANAYEVDAREYAARRLRCGQAHSSGEDPTWSSTPRHPSSP
jgi:hypothetical protein